jgi:predicted flap endonuclease-1-like 5' DNA nuclease
MPDTPTLFLILLTGIASGVLIGLVLDSSYLEKRLQEEKNQQLRLESKLALARSTAKHLREDLEDAKGWREQAAHLLTEKEELEQKLATAEFRVIQLDEQVKDTSQQLTEAQKLRKKMMALSEENSEAKANIKNLRKELKKAQNQMAYMRLGGKENLTLIRGIGPAYARRLQEAGIRTFALLAQASPEHVCEIVQIKPWQNAAPKEWIAEAKQYEAVFSADEEE